MSTRRSESSEPSDAPPLFVRQAADAATYVGAFVGLAWVVASAIGIVLALSYDCSLLRGLNLGKQLLFFGGFGVLAYGAFLLRPKSPRRRGGSGALSGGIGGLTGGIGGPGGGDEDESDASDENPQHQRARDTPHPDIDTEGDDEDEASPFGRVVQVLPPARFFEIDPKDRLSGGTKVLISGFGILVLTMILEFGFGLYAVPCTPA